MRTKNKFSPRSVEKEFSGPKPAKLAEDVQIPLDEYYLMDNYGESLIIGYRLLAGENTDEPEYNL